MLRPPLPTDEPFTLEYAAQLGYSRRMLQGKLFQIIYPTVYAVATLELTPLVMTKAALLATPKHCAASHHGGLRLYGVEVGVDLTPHVSTLSKEPIRIRGIEAHRLEKMTNSMRDGYRVLTPELCLSTAATTLNLVDLVTAIDWMFRLGHTSPDLLWNFLEHHHGAGVRKARRAALLSREGSESPRESYLRVLLEMAGLPPLECNVAYGDEHEFLARVDLSWRRWMIAIEYDGRQHGLSLAQRERDIHRREQMERLGWVFIIVTAAQLHRPRSIVRRVREALRQRQGWAPFVDFSDEWCAMFE